MRLTTRSSPATSINAASPQGSDRMMFVHQATGMAASVSSAHYASKAFAPRASGSHD